VNSDLDNIQPGSTVGPYRIVRGFKGRGGMARVFEVEIRDKYRQPDLARRLALKVAKEEYQGALLAESDFLRRFDHSNVVRIFPLAGYHRPVYAGREHFPFGWGWYYTMELLSAESLERYLTRTTTGLRRSGSGRGHRLGLLKTLGIARQLLAALEHIHERYVINLDIKPGNVLFRRQPLKFLRRSVPQAVLCDFGISRDLRYPRAGLLGVATPEYISPEQTSEMGMSREHVDTRSDIFSVGILLYEMLTGELPFSNIALVADPACTPVPPRQLRASVPPLLERIVMKALAKQADCRFQTATEMRAALEQVPTPPDWGAAARRTVCGVTLAGGLAASIWGIRSSRVTPTQNPTATSTSVTETIHRTPTVSLAQPSLTVSLTATQHAPTSTSAPTSTPTNTPRPRTPTPTSTPGTPSPATPASEGD
jgi:serine/threonine protein kinase